MLTPALPYPTHQGGALRNFGILKGLAQRGHAITLLSFHHNGAPDVLRELCARVEIVPTPERSKLHRLRDLLITGQPDLARRLESAAFRERLRAILSETQFDLIQFEGLEMAIYLDAAREMQPNAKLIYDAHNAEHALQAVIARVESDDRRRWLPALYSRIQARRITRFERQITHAADAVIAVSEEDAAMLRPFRADGEVFSLPNGIFVDDYAQTREVLELTGEPLVFTGKMDYRPNVDAMQWFTEAVLPRITIQRPEARLYIVGQKPHASLQTLRTDERIEITGWVADVQPFLHAAQVYIAPLRMGSGTRLKILEAMAAGCAVVATSAAVAGLNDSTRAALLIADDDRRFAEAVITLLNDPAQRAKLGEAAQAAVRAHYDWSALIPCLLAIYREIGLG